MRIELQSLIQSIIFMCFIFYIFNGDSTSGPSQDPRGLWPPPHIFGKSERFFFIFGSILSSLKFFKRTLLFLFKDVTTVLEAIPVWSLVRYISDTSQYRCTVSGLPLFYIYIYVCMCLCIYIL